MNEIATYLKEYGVDIKEVKECDEKDLLQQGYTKVSNEAKERLDAILQYLPGLGTEMLEKADTIQSVKKLLDGAYRVSIAEGTHLAKSKAMEGAFRGSLLSNANNQVGAGQANLIPLNEEMLKFNISPKIVLGIFDTVSLITGQYYMSEINHKLSAIEAKTNKILSFLDNTLKGELLASDQTLNGIIRDIDRIMANDMQKTAYYQSVIAIKNDSLSKMKFYDLQIDSIKKNISIESNRNEIVSNIQDLMAYYPLYWFALNLYIKSVLCEIVIAQIVDPELLNRMKNDILEHVEKYKHTLNSRKKELLNTIDVAKSLNARKWPLTPKKPIVTHNKWYPLCYLGYMGIAAIKNIHSTNVENKKNMTKQYIIDEFMECGDVSLLKEQADKIGDLIYRTESPIDIIQTKEGTYIKYLSNEVEAIRKGQSANRQEV